MAGMNRALFSLLVGGALLGMVGTAQSKEKPLGKLMCIGDSITHGFGAPSYRWPLHKILVDNEVEFSFVGVTQGNQRPVMPENPQYRGVEYNNRHSAMSSERAYEIAGRINTSGRLGNSNVFDWLGLNKSYKGEFRINPSEEMPDTFVILIGTNDTLSEWGRKGGIGAHVKEATNALLGESRGKKHNGKGDMDTILGALRKANAKARIYVMEIPTWSARKNNNNTTEDFAAIAAYNEELRAWAKHNKVAFIPVNEGMVDVACTDKPFSAVDSMFNAQDHLHPTVQGDLLMAANVAKALGYPGRTAGLMRGEVKGEVKEPLTVELSGTVGDGAKGGWDATELVTLTFTAGGQQGKLSLSESAVKWNGETLYSADLSANREAVRVAFVEAGNEAQVDGGFYIWLGDRLVGEARQGTPARSEPGYNVNSKQDGISVASAEKALAPLAPAKKGRKK